VQSHHDVLRVVPNLNVGKSEDSEAGSDKCLVSPSVLRLLAWSAVITQPIRLHHKLESGPEEVHPKSTHSLLRLRRWQSRSSDEPEEAPLELRIGESEGLPIKDSPKRRGASRASVFVQCGAQ
jgi:hypothetical protein